MVPPIESSSAFERQVGEISCSRPELGSPNGRKSGAATPMTPNGGKQCFEINDLREWRNPDVNRRRRPTRSANAGIRDVDNASNDGVATVTFVCADRRRYGVRAVRCDRGPVLFSSGHSQKQVLQQAPESTRTASYRRIRATVVRATTRVEDTSRAQR